MLSNKESDVLQYIDGANFPEFTNDESGMLKISKEIGSFFKPQSWDDVDAVADGNIIFNNGYDKFHELTIYEFLIDGEIKTGSLDKVSNTEFKPSINISKNKEIKIRVYSFEFNEIKNNGIYQFDTNFFQFSLYDDRNEDGFEVSYSISDNINHGGSPTGYLDKYINVDFIAYNRKAIFVQFNTSNYKYYWIFNYQDNDIVTSHSIYKRKATNDLGSVMAYTSSGLVSQSIRRYINQDPLLYEKNTGLNYFTLYQHFFDKFGSVVRYMYSAIGNYSEIENKPFFKTANGVFLGFFGNAWVKIR